MHNLKGMFVFLSEREQPKPLFGLAFWSFRFCLSNSTSIYWESDGRWAGCWKHWTINRWSWREEARDALCFQAVCVQEWKTFYYRVTPRPGRVVREGESPFRKQSSKTQCQATAGGAQGGECCVRAWRKNKNQEPRTKKGRGIISLVCERWRWRRWGEEGERQLPSSDRSIQWPRRCPESQSTSGSSAGKVVQELLGLTACGSVLEMEIFGVSFTCWFRICFLKRITRWFKSVFESVVL